MELDQVVELISLQSAQAWFCRSFGLIHGENSGLLRASLAAWSAVSLMSIPMWAGTQTRVREMHLVENWLRVLLSWRIGVADFLFRLRRALRVERLSVQITYSFVGLVSSRCTAMMTAQASPVKEELRGWILPEAVVLFVELIIATETPALDLEQSVAMITRDFQ